MIPRTLIWLAWVYRLLALAAALGGPVLAIASVQIDAALRRAALEQGIVTSASLAPVLWVIVALLVTLALLTTGEVLMGLARMIESTTRAADALERIRGKR